MKTFPEKMVFVFTVNTNAAVARGNLVSLSQISFASKEKNREPPLFTSQKNTLTIIIPDPLLSRNCNRTTPLMGRNLSYQSYNLEEAIRAIHELIPGGSSLIQPLILNPFVSYQKPFFLPKISAGVHPTYHYKSSGSLPQWLLLILPLRERNHPDLCPWWNAQTVDVKYPLPTWSFTKYDFAFLASKQLLVQSLTKRQTMATKTNHRKRRLL